MSTTGATETRQAHFDRGMTMLATIDGEGGQNADRRNEIVEALLHSAVYCGMPKALNATFVPKKVFSAIEDAVAERYDASDRTRLVQVVGASALNAAARRRSCQSWCGRRVDGSRGWGRVAFALDRAARPDRPRCRSVGDDTGGRPHRSGFRFRHAARG